MQDVGGDRGFAVRGRDVGGPAYRWWAWVAPPTSRSCRGRFHSIWAICRWPRVQVAPPTGGRCRRRFRSMCAICRLHRLQVAGVGRGFAACGRYVGGPAYGGA